MVSPRILLFGDNTFGKLECVKSLARQATTSSILTDYLRNAVDVAQIEIAKLGSSATRDFCAFDTLLEIAEEHGKQQEANEIINVILACIFRLGELIMLAENDPTFLNSTSPMHIVGLCTGSIPAAVAAVARSTTEVIKIGLQMVAISCRLAISLVSRSECIEAGISSWGCRVCGIDAISLQTILDEFHRSQGIPTHKHIYLGVISRSWITILGPPSVLADLFSCSDDLKQAPTLEISIGAAFHADHLPPLDLERIFGDSSFLDATVKPNAQFLSSHTGLPYAASDLRALLSRVIPDITQNILHLTKVIENTASNLSGTEHAGLFVVGPTSQALMMQHALENLNISVNVTERLKVPTESCQSRAGSGSIAIVGMSGRFPGSDNVEGFWNSIQEGLNACAKVPKSRFDVESHFGGEGAMYGCFLEAPGLFDNRLFNLSPREAAQMDPLQRLLLMTSYEALEQTGYSPNSSLAMNRSRISTYVGQATDDWHAVNECEGIDIYFVPGVVRSFNPGRLNFHYKWGGGSYSVDSACASSSTAITLACSDLLARKCDTAVAGGGNLLVAPSLYAGLSRGGFLSPTGACKTFSDAADGYCRGEGVGLVVLKRLEDAITDHDNIQAIIKSFARTSSAGATSITHPHAPTQSEIYNRVLRKACLDPEDVNYVEMHGTGTQAGDVCEMQSVTDVFGQNRTEENPLIVGAVKANIGHGEAAAGVTSLIKMVMMLRNNSVPPQPSAPFRMNHKFPPLEAMRTKIPFISMDFRPTSRSDGKRRMLLNNFDASGGNTCLVIEDPPPRRIPQTQDPRTYHVVTCSGRTSFSLAENKRRLVEYLNSNPETEVSDVAYTTTARRQHETLRSAYPVKNVKDLKHLISEDLAGKIPAMSSRRGRSSVAVFVFTGQGSIYAGVAGQLFHTCGRFREMILSYQKFCDNLGLPPIIDIITNSELDLQRHTTTIQIQLALVIVDIALAKLWMSWGLRPRLLIGHSLGEYAALCISGVLSVSDTLYLVGKRASMIQEACSLDTHSMLAIGGAVDVVSDVLASQQFRSCQISCMNAPANTTVSGPKEDLVRLETFVRSRGLRAMFLNVRYGFHSSQMSPILAEYQACAKGFHFAKPKIPIVSTLTATVVNDVGTFCPEYLSQQAREPVRFAEALQACSITELDESRLWIEVGPNPICLDLIGSNLHVEPTTLLPSLKNSEENWKTITSSIVRVYESDVPFDWIQYHQEYTEALTLLELPTYAFDLKDFWSSYRQKPCPGRDDTIAVPSSRDPKPGLNTCLQRVVKESFESEEICVTFLSHLSDPLLQKAIRGHLVAETALCPASIFCDIAYTAAKYIYDRENPGKTAPQMSLRALDLTHPLTVLTSEADHIIEIVAKMYGNDKSSVYVAFSSRRGSFSTDNGTCEVYFENSHSWEPGFLRSLYLVKSRMTALIDSVTAGRGHRLTKSFVYKLFADLVRYDAQYQSIDVIFLDENYADAVAVVTPISSSDAGTFTCNPYWIDSFIHLAGFVLNGNVTKSENTVYLATGFDSLRILEELSEKKTYKIYVTVHLGEAKGIVISDVYVLESEKLVAHCAGLKFRQITRNVLKSLLNWGSPPIHGEHSETGVSTAKPKSTEKMVLGNHIEQLSKPLTTPVTSVSTSNSGQRVDVLTGQTSSPRSPLLPEGCSDDADSLLALVALETGLELDELEDSTRFADVGVDSLMSIAIVSAAKHQLGLELSASFFIDNPTVSDVRAQLRKGQIGKYEQPQKKFSSQLELDGPHPSSQGSSCPSASQANNFSSQIDPIRSHKLWVSETEGASTYKSNSMDRLSANVVLMQGLASSTSPPLFLIADGAGSAAAYIHIPRLSHATRVYAVESPFLTNPNAYTVSIPEISQIFQSAIVRTNPLGPYIIGGWSAGAVYAYEVSRQLLVQGREVLGLIIMDMHIPRPMPWEVEPTVEFIQQAGLDIGLNHASDGSIRQTQMLKQHLASTVRALMSYQPTPMAPACRPGHVFLIWAGRGLNETAGDNGVRRFWKKETKDPMLPLASGELPRDHMGETPAQGLAFETWFFGERSDFGPKGWEELVGEVECHVMEADHFSMVVPPHVRVLGDFLEHAVGICNAHLQ